MSFLKPDPPTPPNPIDTARAATGTNIGTAVANANLQNINQVTPGGSLTYSTTGNYSWTDPTTGQNYSIPQFTATQTPTPVGQLAINNQQEAQYRLVNQPTQTPQDLPIYWPRVSHRTLPGRKAVRPATLPGYQRQQPRLRAAVRSNAAWDRKARSPVATAPPIISPPIASASKTV
jgi:hypothetical protein